MLVGSDYGRRWLLEPPKSLVVWACVAICAAGGLTGWAIGFPYPMHPGQATLLAMPLLQSLSFVALDRLFRLLMRRTPATFDDVRYERERKLRPDRIYWAIAMFGLVAATVWICSALGVEFPLRHR